MTTAAVTTDSFRDQISNVRDAMTSVKGARDSERERETGILARNIRELRHMRLARANRDLTARAEQVLYEAMRVYHQFTDGTEDHDLKWAE